MKSYNNSQNLNFTDLLDTLTLFYIIRQEVHLAIDEDGSNGVTSLKKDPTRVGGGLSNIVSEDDHDSSSYGSEEASSEAESDSESSSLEDSENGERKVEVAGLSESGSIHDINNIRSSSPSKVIDEQSSLQSSNFKIKESLASLGSDRMI